MAQIHHAWKYLSVLALIVLAGQAAPPPPAQPVLPGLRVVTNNGVTVINNGDGSIVITGGGQLIIGGQAIQSAPQLPAIDENWDMPLVGSGYASDKPIDGSILPLVRDLKAEQYDIRENATQALLRLPPDRLDDITAALATERDAEAITRLKEVAGYLYLKARTPVKTPSRLFGIGMIGEYSALIGIPIDDLTHDRSEFFVPVRVQEKDGHAELATPGNEKRGDLRMTLRVRDIQPGFPATQALRIGDLIEAINGTPLPLDLDAERFVDIVKELWPGRVVTITVVRGGHLVDVPVQTVAVPSDLRNNADRLSAWIETRKELRERFVNRLKTGEKQQASAKDERPKTKDESAQR